jgi:aminoglycoside N3'-acetyltransferase
MGDDAEIIQVTSRLITFANRLECDLRTAHYRLLDSLLQAAGPDRTLVMPAFTLSYGKSRRYDPIRDKPETGVLVIAAWERDWMRTRRPMMNWVAWGARADEIMAQNQTTALGDDSVAAWLVNHDARAIGVGVTDVHHGWVVVHRAEEICQVPYRYYKKMPGELFIDGQPHGTCEEVLYAKPLLANIGHTYAQLTERLSSAGELWNNDDPLFPLRAVQCRRVVDRSIELLEANTLAFVAHRDEARKWLSDLKGQELGELKPEERFDKSEVP